MGEGFIFTCSVPLASACGSCGAVCLDKVGEGCEGGEDFAFVFEGGLWDAVFALKGDDDFNGVEGYIRFCNLTPEYWYLDETC